MKKNSAFQLRSGNKPSMSQLSGISPVKLSQFQKDVQARKAKNKAKLKAKRAEAKTSGKPKEPSKIKQDVTSVFGRLDKAIQGFFNNPRSTAAGGDKKTYLPPKKGIASGGDKGGFKAVTFKGKKGDPYSYRTLEGGGYEYSTDGKKFTKATTKGNKAIDKLFKSK